MQRPAFAFALAVVLSAASVARADAHQDAARLFEAGRALRDRDKCQEALTAFKASVEIEPSVGGFYNIGTCSEKLGQHAEAIGAYRMSSQIAESKKDPRAQEGKDAIKALLGRTHWVLVQVPEDVAKRPGLEIRLDGQVVPPERYNTHVFGPSASHDLRVRVPGRPEVAIPAPDQQSVTVALPAEKAPDAAPAAAPAAHVTTPPPDEGPKSPSMFASWGWQKWTGAGLGVAGLVTTGIGAFLTIDYFSDKSSLEDAMAAQCPIGPNAEGKNEYQCPPGAKPRLNELAGQYNENETSAKSTLPIVFGAGALLLAGGAVLFLTAPSGENAAAGASAPRRTLTVAPTLGRVQGVSIVGTF